MSEIAYYGEAASPITVANTTQTGTQDSGQVAALAGGGFVMVWRDVSGAANPGPDIRAQIFDASGGKVGGEFLVNTVLTTNVAVPAVTGTPDGGFVVSWSDQTNGIRARAFNATGTAATPGEVTVQDGNAGTVGQNSIAALANGNYMVTWGVTGTPVGGVTPRDVHAKIYDASGTALTTDFIVSSSTTGNQALPRVAAVGTSFVVAWTDDRLVNGQNVGQEVLAQRFDASGGRLGGEINVDGGAALNQSNAAIATLADGSFEIVWRNSDGSASGDWLSAQHFAADGTPISSARDVSAPFYYSTDFSFSGMFQAPAIVADAQGGFIVSWVAMTTVGGSTYSQIVAQQFDSAGGPLGDPIVLTNNDAAPKSSVAGARLTSDQIVSAWATTTPSLPAQGVDAQFQLFEVYQRIFGTAAADTLTNNTGKKAAIYGGDGNDMLRGHAGDQIDGGDDNDTITVDGAHATIYGGQGDDIIEGVSDQVYGGEGNDQIHVTGVNVTELIVLDGGVGDDVITADGTYSTGPFVIGGDGDDYLTGSFGNDLIDGGEGDDVLVGRGGTNTLIGGAGNDFYVISSSSDVIFETPGNGYDTVKTSVNFTLGSGVDVEVMRLLGTSNLNLTGNSISQVLVGNTGDNVLDGGGGGDGLKGRGGNDTFVVRNAADTIVEFVGEGDDTVKAAVSYTLGAGVEVEHLWVLDFAATTAINLTGNDYSHDIQGNAGVNVLTGGSGDDFLVGNGGADTLIGGDGNDTYRVSDSATVIVEATGGGSDSIKSSVDYVLGVGVEVEVIRLAEGSAGLNLTGNGFASKLVGNSGDNVLDGGGGGDVMRGGMGNDTYIVRDGSDRIVEATGEGNDTVQAAVGYSLTSDTFVETLRTIDAAGTTAINLTGNDHTLVIQGNAGANVLTGGAGNEMISGFAGNDTLFGGGGNDVFVFAGGTGQDSVGDFVSGSDKLDLSAFFTSFTQVQAATHDAGGNAVIDLGGGDSVTLNGFLTAQLQLGDVIVGSSGAALESGGAHNAVVSRELVDVTNSHDMLWQGLSFHHPWGAEPLTLAMV